MISQPVYKKLVELATSRGVTDYTTVARMIGLDMESPADRNAISLILDEINLYEHENNRPMLSSVVIRQDINLPGDGYFDCARRLEYRVNDPVVFWANELIKVHNYWAK